MPAPTAACDVFVVIDQDGDYAVGNTADEARCRYEFEVGPLGNCDGLRILKITALVPLPEDVVLTVA